MITVSSLRNQPAKPKSRALYAAAGLSLEDDLEALNKAARISANPASVEYLEQNIIFNGDIHIPVLTMHTEGDGLVSNENEHAYRDTVHEAGHNRLLRETFVHRAGHCAFHSGGDHHRSQQPDHPPGYRPLA